LNSATKYYWPNFWYHKIKVNVIPYDTKNRRPILNSFKEYRKKRIPLELFNQWLEKGLFAYGMAIIPGKIYSHDPNQVLFLVVLDFDKKEGFDEFCKYKSNNMTLELWAKRTILEQHPDNLDRAHMYFLSPIPFPNKGADTKIGIEVKSRAEHGIIFATNSPHEDGSRYQIQGTKDPWILSNTQAIEMIQHINGICYKYGLEYVEKKVLLDAEIKKMIKNLRIPKNINIKLTEGERHNNLISIANSILFRHYRKDESGDSNANELKSFFESLSEKLCEPELIPQDESDSIWNSCLEFVKSNKKFDNDNPNRLSFLEKNKTSSDLIEQATELILENNYFITLEETKEILYYESGVYVPGGEIIIEKEAEKMFGFDLGNKHLSEIKGHIIRKTYYKRDELDIDLNIINLQNGLYNWREHKLYPHTPDYLSVNQKPIIYDPKVRPKYFGNFLKDVLYPVVIRTAIEAIAYTFLRDTPFEHFFKLFGYGMNGKSVYTGIIT